MTTTTAPPAPTPAPTRERAQSLKRSLLILVAIAAVAACAPFVLPESRQSIAIRVLIFAMMAIGWNLMSGYGGMFSFGHAAYFGIGAYTDTYLLVTFGWSPWLALVVGAALAALVAAGIGYVAFRYKLRSAYFALGTFAIAEMLRLLATNTKWVNGTTGYHVPLLPESSWTMLQFGANAAEYFYIGLAMVVVCMVVTLLYLRSRSGIYTVAIRDNEDAADALGISVMRVRLTTMALSAAITAAAGMFYAQYYTFVDPDTAFGSAQSVQAIAPAVIGGVATPWGPLVGALILGPLADLTVTWLRTPPAFLDFLTGRSGLDVVLYAILLIVIALVLPKGIVGSIQEWWKRR
ncbi:branched-chain amino acid ABC transporter permease [Streptomyces brasiliensis]|uniref:Amino acid ABC transporter permease n=1 Tax=Streptomyces brasiliensis TaxID=1954 RepID=A0A917L7F7_9ACTN|nr:branched-chain amino acid ABC transporter permease [Streptomyces brasiliensis]GGJ50070.1 amino acid ABC transporter permease [Streptomyces brasiliensis]